MVKVEPEEFSWEQLLQDGKVIWDGVRNYQARNFMREMSVGDQVLYYHSSKAREIVGIATVSEAAFPDPTAEDDKGWVAVELKPLEALKTPVSLDQIKSDGRMDDMYLVRQSRLSVMPVSDSHYDMILQLSEEGNGKG